MNKTLVFGSNGHVARCLKTFTDEPIFIGKKEVDLTNQCEADTVIKMLKPETVVLLSSKVGGIKYNLTNPCELAVDNFLINTNAVNACIKNGVKNFVGMLSTCVYPNDCSETMVYPMSEECIWEGPVYKGHRGYGQSKRALFALTQLARQSGLNYKCLSPSNLYSEFDHFDPTDGHFVASLIAKGYFDKGSKKIKLWGDGKPVRQQTYTYDLCKVIMWVLENPELDFDFLNVATPESLSIKETAEIFKKVFKIDKEIEFSGEMGGQHCKDVSSEKLLKMYDGFEFTTFEEGLTKVKEELWK